MSVDGVWILIPEVETLVELKSDFGLYESEQTRGVNWVPFCQNFSALGDQIIFLRDQSGMHVVHYPSFKV